MQRGLVVLHREQAIASFFDDFLGDRSLCSHGIDGHQSGLDFDRIKQRGDRCPPSVREVVASR